MSTDFDRRIMLAAKYAGAGLAEAAQAELAGVLAEPHAPAAAWELAAEIERAGGAGEAALSAITHALSREPERVSALLLQALILQGLGRTQEAAQAYEAALKIAPNVPEAWNNLAILREDLGQAAPAKAAYEQAIALAPAYVEAHANLAAFLAGQGYYAAAVRAGRAALSHDPAHAPARINVGVALLEQGRHDEAAEALTGTSDHPDGADAALYLLHHVSNDPAAVAAAHKHWAAQAHPQSPRLPARPRARPLRVGYVSADFRQHSVAYFIEPLLAHHDRGAVEVFCYAQGGKADAVTTRLRAHAAHWHDISARDDDAACALVRAHGIDVLVDLGGHTRGNRLGLFARRAAPVQITALGYPGTTGLAAMDVRLCDAVTDPPGTEAGASERLVRLPRLHCYQPPPAAPAPGPLPATRNGHVTFGSFNKLGKLSDATVALWAAVLKAVPTARLFLKSKALAEEETRAHTAQRFAAHGIAPQRLTLFGWVPADTGHLATYERLDIALDTFPYSGTTTTCEALWMGVPVLTLTGRTHASRVSASLLTTVGLADWRAGTAQDFIARAAAAAADLSGLAALRGSLRNQVAASPLCDGPAYARAVEAAYVSLVD